MGLAGEGRGEEGWAGHSDPQYFWRSAAARVMQNRQTQSGPKHRKKSSKLRRRLKTVSNADEVTLDGKLFHTRKAATGSVRSPMVEWRIGSTTSVNVDAYLRRRRESMSATLWSSSARYGGAVKCRQRYVSTASLNSIRCGARSQCKGKERKSIYTAPFCTKVHTKRSGMVHTVLPANNTMPAFPS